MKTAVIYHSQTSFTKRYAQWIADAANADCFELSEARKKNLTAYEAIVLGSWAKAAKKRKSKAPPLPTVASGQPTVAIRLQPHGKFYIMLAEGRKTKCRLK